MNLPPEEDEFLRADVTKAACIDAPGPRVAESPAHFECRYLGTHRLTGGDRQTWVDVGYGEVVRINVDDSVILPDGKLLVPNDQAFGADWLLRLRLNIRDFRDAHTRRTGLLGRGSRGKSKISNGRRSNR